MAKVTRDQLLKRPFQDRKNYPYGFSRSGDFSISESKALEQYGSLIAALVDGQLPPSTDEDNIYIAAAFGEKDPEGPAERAWAKYQKRINRPKLASINGSQKASVNEDDDAASGDNDDAPEIELDDE